MKFVAVIISVLITARNVLSDTLHLQASVRGEAELPCTLPHQQNVSSEDVMYIQKMNSVVFELYKGKEKSEHQDKLFTNRTWLDAAGGSVWLKDIRTADEGLYGCFILRAGSVLSSQIELSVVANFSVPVISLSPTGPVNYGDVVNLTCTSNNGYPNASLHWIVNTENLIVQEDYFSVTSDWIQDPETKLFNLTSVLNINVTTDLMILCSLYNSTLNNSLIYLELRDIEHTSRTYSRSHVFGFVAAIPLLVLVLVIVVLLKRKCP
ncbi:T-lymphocyte activation antigen CD86-like [Acipenser ruthenus]|uniref:T-lymphocyte activation antigen CD86-like n=1 Tax=Acipenser ruthenus TaxID=7906 RepID=UPI00145AD60B|nr:T-lymphocyte activation antigen CD86-like [Acipenser ruthenus]XP_033867591.1 T-lymphocyte activation antigen CD86-like [Acipenser ruthenus]